MLTIGSIQGGTRYNIIPDSVEMLGTLRTFDEEMRAEAMKRIVTTAESIAASSGAKARVTFGPVAYPVTTNPAALTEASLPALKLATGGKAMVIPKVSGSEDFSEFQKVAPGFFYFLGAPPKGADFKTAPSNHSPLFDIDEAQLPVGARSLAALAVSAGAMVGVVQGLPLLIPRLWPAERVFGWEMGAAPAKAWVVSEEALDAQGRAVSMDGCYRESDALIRECVEAKGGVGFETVYHPVSHAVPLHLAETALILVLTAALAFAALRLLRRRTP